MRKFSKLILAILPVSSLTVFSVVSCSTNDKKPIETPKTPDNKTPDNQPKQPEDQTDKENHNIDKPGEEKQTDGEPSPGMPDEQPSPSQPKNKPHNPETQPRQPKEPKKPIKPNETEKPRNENGSVDNSNNDQPQGDEPSNESDFFSDVDTLKKEIDFQYFSTYKNRDALSAWVEIKGRGQAIFKEVIFLKNIDILEKYQIEFDNNNQPDFIHEKGIISNVRIKFSKNRKSKVYVFTFTGFKINTPKVDNTKNKENYIKARKKIDERLSGLYPSLVAYMLLYVEENHSNNKYDRTIKQIGNVVNFDELKNQNVSLFDKKFAGFSVGTKELLFEYEERNRKIYKDKITQARYDDTNGVLELEIQISNTDDHRNNQSDPNITKRFKFEGFKRIDFDDSNKNPLKIWLAKKDLNNLINDGNLKTIITQLTQYNYYGKKIPIVDLNENNLKNKLFQKLLVSVDQNLNHLYNSNQTLTIDNRNNEGNYKSILGLKDNMSIYPFHSRITKDSITKVYVTMNKKAENKELEIDVEMEIPIYSSTLSDLTDNTYEQQKKLKLKFSQKTEIKLQ
uniref:Uncharacterized protein n=1 Tax=Mycoplasma feriruminatoris TaxID=1179777 RepID=A0A654IJH3_9MOLU|nr:hypothetical protein MF5295_00739 [Mycoplasma feriruminatoris]